MKFLKKYDTTKIIEIRPSEIFYDVSSYKDGQFENKYDDLFWSEIWEELLPAGQKIEFLCLGCNRKDQTAKLHTGIIESYREEWEDPETCWLHFRLLKMKGEHASHWENPIKLFKYKEGPLMKKLQYNKDHEKFGL